MSTISSSPRTVRTVAARSRRDGAVMRRHDARPAPPLSLFGNAGNQRSLGLLDRIAPQTMSRTVSPGNLAIQRKCASCEQEDERFAIQRQARTASETRVPRNEVDAVEEVAAVPLIVDDDSAQVGPGQMRKSDFLAMLRAAVCAAVDDEMAGTGRSSKGCPHVEFWFARYAEKPASQVERALRKFEPETVSAESATDYVPIVVARIRRSVRIWAETGEMTGVPEDLPREMGGSGAEDTGGAAGGSGGGVAFQSKAGGAGRAGSPEAIRDQLGPGRLLDSRVRARMESAFGTPFGDVRVHTDAPGARLSHKLNARAFTVGTHVAFDAGEYRPGTVTGDALLAHELAHVVQQRSSDQRVTQGAASQADQGFENRGLEEDADRAAVHALTDTVSGPRHGVSRLWQGMRARLGGGLRLQRCGRERCPPGEAFFPKAGMAIGNLGPGLCRWECFPIPPEERVEEGVEDEVGQPPPRTIFDREPTAVTTKAFFNANLGICLCDSPKDPETGEELPQYGVASIDCASVGIPAGKGKGARATAKGSGAGRAPARRGAGKGGGTGKTGGAGTATGKGKGKGTGKGAGKGKATTDDFLRTATRQELVDFVGGADAVRAIAKRLHSGIPSEVAKDRRVIALGVAREGPGHPPRLICAVSANRVKDVQKVADELGIEVISVPATQLRAQGRASRKTPHVQGAPGDAEQRLIEAARMAGLELIAAVPSRKACGDCVSALRAENVLLIDPAD